MTIGINIFISVCLGLCRKFNGCCHCCFRQINSVGALTAKVTFNACCKINSFGSICQVSIICGIYNNSINRCIIRSKNYSDIIGFIAIIKTVTGAVTKVKLEKTILGFSDLNCIITKIGVESDILINSDIGKKDKKDKENN